MILTSARSYIPFTLSIPFFTVAQLNCVNEENDNFTVYTYAPHVCHFLRTYTLSSQTEYTKSNYTTIYNSNIQRKEVLP